MFKKTSNNYDSKHSTKESITSSFLNITASLKQMISLSKVYNFDDLENVHNTLQELNRQNISLQKKIKQCLISIPKSDNYIFVDCPPSMEIEEFCDIYRYRLNDLIPHIIRLNTDNNKLNYLYDTNEVYSGYRRAVEEYAKITPFKTFTKKIIVCFINYYENESDGIDVDNLDTKPFIDAAISRILVPDDNPKWVNVALLTTEGNPHTEVIVGYPKEVYQYLSANFIFQ